MRSILTSLLFASVCSYASESQITPQSCQTSCASPFGTQLGTGNGVVGYSNCNPDCESDQWHTITIGQQTLQSGMKWQCVEYARRWYMQQLGYTFASIDHAYQIWDLAEATKLESNAPTPWNKFANTKTNQQPQANDLLIYNKKQGVHGHVSVIVKVADGYVYIAEQNYANAKWETETYARKAPLIRNAKGQYSIKDLGVIGWMRLQG